MPARGLTILYLIENCGHGGAEAQIAMQASAVSALGHNAIVAAPGTGWLMQELARRGIPAHSLSVQRNRAAPLRWTREILRLLAADRVDLIQSYLLQMNIAGALAGKLARIPAVASVRGEAYDFDRPWRLWAYRFIAGAGVTITTPSQALRQALLERTRIPPERVIAIHNGVDLGRFDDAAGRPATAQLPRGFRIGAVGRLDPVKGLDHLIRAAAIVAPRAPDARFVIIGDGAERAALEEHTRRLGVRDAITFLGHRDDVPALLRCLDVFVQPSLSEGLSNSVLEAMAAGCPVIATDIGPNCEVVRHRRSGLLVPPGNADALARAILELHDDRALAADLARGARATVEAGFSLTRSAERYVALYCALVGRKRPRRAEDAAAEARVVEHR